MEDIDDDHIVINLRRSSAPFTHVEHFIRINRYITVSNELRGKIVSIDGQHYPEVKVTLDNEKVLPYASVFEFLWA
ncbi:hypothetical protein [Caballeronia sordidicola]|uniref:hypothetical protein n=1 Tax=Caballeronia sordidicola TaxID=196367 RepID=UPI00126A77DB|nr:hypothetical protein [Caballeronia sordidicola]